MTRSTAAPWAGAPGRRRRRWPPLGLPFAALAAAAVALAPLPLDPVPHRLAAIFVAVVALWVTEALPVAATALLIAPLLVAFGVTDAETAFAPYADPLLFLFVGGFFLARSMTLHGLDQRIARAIVTLPGIRGAPTRTVPALVAGGVLLSMWVSNTATTAILVPITLGLFDARSRLAGRAVLAIAYAASVGGLGTLVGSPPNLITARFLREANVDFGFVDWLVVGMPTALGAAALTLLVLRPPAPDAEDPASAPVVPAGEARRPWSRGEVVTAVAFALAVVGWIVPGVLSALGAADALVLVRGAGERPTVTLALPEGAVAVLAATVLFVVRDAPRDDGTRPPVLPWARANEIDWGIILLFGGGISLGTQMFETGLAAELARGFVAASGVRDVWTLTAIVLVFTILFTEVCSNTASANMLAPLVIAAAQELGVSPIPPTLAVGLAASCAFMLPIATGPNAIAYGTGRVSLGTMFRAGAALNLACALWILALLRLLAPWLGWV